MNTNLSLSDAIDQFLEAKQAQRLSENTLIDYRRTLKRFKTIFNDDPLLTSLTPHNIRQFMNSLDGLSKKSVLNCHIALSSLWTWAVEDEICPENIVHKVKRPRPEIRAIEPFTRQEVEALINSFEHSRKYSRPGKRSCTNRLPHLLRNRAIILLLLDTGIRSTELCNLRIADIRVYAAKVFGKGTKERVVPMSERTYQAIQEYLNEARVGYTLKDYMFVTRGNRPLKNDELYHLILHAGERCGVINAHTHKFRHTFAINFLRNGGNIYALQMILGHASLEMVKRYLAIAQADLEMVHKIASPVTRWEL